VHPLRGRVESTGSCMCADRNGCVCVCERVHLAQDDARVAHGRDVQLQPVQHRGGARGTGVPRVQHPRLRHLLLPLQLQHLGVRPQVRLGQRRGPVHLHPHAQRLCDQRVQLERHQVAHHLRDVMAQLHPTHESAVLVKRTSRVKS